MHLKQQEIDSKNKLPLWNLIALSVNGFLAIMTETIPAGLLPQISEELNISESLAGQFITSFAVGAVVAAIPLVTWTRRWQRKKVLLIGLSVLFIANTLTALSNVYIIILILRFLAGMATGLLWGLIAGYARRMVAPTLQGRALAIAGTGQPIALSLGVPIGTWLAVYLEWQTIFLLISILTFGLIVWIVIKMPDYPGQPSDKQQSLYGIVKIPGIRSILFVVFTWILAHNILYTYIAPYLAHVALQNYIGIALFIFGISSIVGIWLIGLWIDQHSRLLTLTSLGAFASAALILGIASNIPWLVFMSIAVWGLTFGGAPTLLQTAMADAAGEEADVAQSIFVTIFNLSVAGGGIVGGFMLNQLGAGSFPWLLLLLSGGGYLLVYAGSSHAFKRCLP